MCIMSLGAAIVACEDRLSARNNDMTIEINTDIALLSKFIHLPMTPKNAWWFTKETGEPGLVGPQDWRLVAVLEFDSAALKKLISNADINDRTSADMAYLSPESRRLVAPHGTVAGPWYNPSVFERSPLLQGSFAKIDDSKIFLSLSTM